jgi:hypothetical protein
VSIEDGFSLGFSRCSFQTWTRGTGSRPVWFVEEEDARSMDQPPGNFGPGAHTTRRGFFTCFAPLRQPDRLGAAVDQAFRFGARQPAYNLAR